MEAEPSIIVTVAKGYYWQVELNGRSSQFLSK